MVPDKKRGIKISQQMAKRCIKGFTLIELVVTLAVVAIILTIAVANFSQFMNENRVYALALEIKTNLASARAESIKRGGLVKICGKQAAEQCGSSFANGWIVFRDENDDGNVDDGDTIIQINDIRDSSLQLTALSDGNAISTLGFNYRGIASASADFTVTRGEKSRSISLSRSGRVEMP